LLAFSLMIEGPAARSEEWPTRPVRVLIPFTAGGTADTLCRIAAEKLSAAFSQQFIPENKPGASGLIAAAETANAAPDGYTLFVSGVGGLIISSAISPKPPADAVSGYTHIADFGGPPAVLVVNNDVPAGNLKEFIAYAKANPGRLNYGSPSPGSLANLAFMLFQREAGIALQSIAYRGASHAMTDLMGGHLAVTCTALTSAADEVGKALLDECRDVEKVGHALARCRRQATALFRLELFPPMCGLPSPGRADFPTISSGRSMPPWCKACTKQMHGSFSHAKQSTHPPMIPPLLRSSTGRRTRNGASLPRKSLESKSKRGLMPVPRLRLGLIAKN